MKNLLLIAALLFSASPSFADSFSHYHLRGADGTPVTIDFQKTSDFLGGSSRGFAAPVYFNIGNNLPANANVKVEIAFYNICTYRCSGDFTTMTRDFKQFDRTLVAPIQANGQASAKTDSIIVSLGSGNGSYRYLQKIRVTIEGVPLIDSVSRTEWFTVELNGNN